MELLAECKGHCIAGITIDARNRLFGICSSTGEILYFDFHTSRFVSVCSTDAAPAGLAVDGATGEAIITNHAEQVVMRCSHFGDDEHNLPTFAAPQPYFSKFEGKSFLGPTAVAVHPVSGEVFFTDAGCEGDSTIAHPSGAVYRTVQDCAQIVPLCSGGLQQPSAIAVGKDGCVFVCERGANRVLRFVPKGSHFVGATFVQLQGTMGPSAVAISPRDGSIYVAMYEPEQLGSIYPDATSSRSDGTVLVFDRHGHDKGIITLPGSQLRGVAVNADGSQVFVVHADEETCTSKLYCVDVDPSTSS